MTFSIGRVGTDITLDNPAKVSVNGNRVTFEQPAQTCSSLADLEWLQQQLQGLANNPDEPTVPVIWSDDTTFTGYYRVISVDTGLASASLAAFSFPWKVELERISRYATRLAESVWTISQRTGSAPTTLAIMGIPPSTYGLIQRKGSLSSATASRTGSDGALTLVYSTASGQQVMMQWGSTPANYYLGSCYVKVGSSYRYATGQMLAPDANWEIGNSLVKVVNVAASSQITVSHYSGGYRAKAYKLLAVTSSTQLDAPSAIAVLRNSPECVILRTFHSVSGSAMQVQVTHMLRRGSYIVESYMNYGNVASIGISLFKVMPVTLETSTSSSVSSVTYVQASGADASGDKYTLMTRATVTADTVNGGFSISNPASSFAFGIAADMGISAGSATVPGDSVTSLASQYNAVVDEATVVIQ